MNFVSSSCFVVRILKNQVVLALFLSILLSIYLFGCSDNVLLPSAEQLAEFQNAGPVPPTVDLDRLVRARIGVGPYRVVPGDVLELTMPAILQVVTADAPQTTEKFTPYVCRVSESCAITLPVVGEIEAAGKTLAEIESAVIDAYYPQYAVIRPSVFARITEYRTARVSITGAVEEPGIYELRTDQMSLVSLIMTAGGIVDDGAAVIRVTHNDQPEPAAWQEEDSIRASLKHLLNVFDPDGIAETADVTVSEGRVSETEPIVLPVKGLNIPFADVALRDGDSVEVERLELPLVTVVGLVNKPGNFPYPPNVQYNLMQALGFAGGLNQAAEPRYATVYRLKADGEIVSAAFNFWKGSGLTDGSNVLIKPGDIVAVEHTSRTRTKLFLERMFRINMGLYVPISDIIGDDK